MTTDTRVNRHAKAKAAKAAHEAKTRREFLAIPPEKRCRVCQRDEAVNRLRYESLTGEAILDLCWPCTGSRLIYGWGKDWHLDNVPMTTQEIFEKMPKNKKCAECGEDTRGAHWHFYTGKGPHKPDRGGRVYYCSAECCPREHHTTGGAVAKASAADDEFDFDDDEFVFDDDEEEEDDDFVFGDDDEEDDDDEYVFDDEDDEEANDTEEDDDEWDF